MRICIADGCYQKMLAKNLCRKHYYRTRRRPDGGFEDRRRALYGATVRERYEHLIDRSGGPDACHPWLGATDKGYGVFWAGEFRASGTSKLVRAHVYGFGPIPDGHDRVRHLCHNKLCQNPKHWAPGTARDNYNDSVRDGRPLGCAIPKNIDQYLAEALDA